MLLAAVESEFARVPTRLLGATLNTELTVAVRETLLPIAGFLIARLGRLVDVDEVGARFEVASASALRFSGTRERVGRVTAGIEEGIEVDG